MRHDVDGIARFRPMFCRRCGSVGTIVQLGMCCRVQDLVRQDAEGIRFRALPARVKPGRKPRVPSAWREAA